MSKREWYTMKKGKGKAAKKKMKFADRKIKAEKETLLDKIKLITNKRNCL